MSELSVAKCRLLLILVKFSIPIHELHHRVSVRRVQIVHFTSSASQHTVMKPIQLENQQPEELWTGFQQHVNISYKALPLFRRSVTSHKRGTRCSQVSHELTAPPQGHTEYMFTGSKTKPEAWIMIIQIFIRFRISEAVIRKYMQNTMKDFSCHLPHTWCAHAKDGFFPLKWKWNLVTANCVVFEQQRQTSTNAQSWV